MSLQGANELRARLKAIKLTFKGYGRVWADETVTVAKRSVPNRDTKWSTGRLHDSIRRKSATQRKAVVAAHYTAYFVDAGPKPHALTARKDKTKFASKAAKRHPGYAARPFRAKAAQAALRRHPMRETMLRLWNGAA